MNILDLVIVPLLILQAAHWAQGGFSRKFLSLAGFWLGIVAGAILVPVVVRSTGDAFVRLALALLVIFSLAVVFGTVGRIFGHRLRAVLARVKLGRADAILGAVFGVVAGLAVVWVLAGIVSGTPFKEANRLVRDSFTVQQLNRIMPAPPEALSRIAGLINPERFPQIFVGPEPRPVAPVTSPSSAEVAAALDTAGESVVRLESQGCGGTMFGSGFVAAPDIIVTNAHVVAGINRPMVVDQGGQREGRIVYFDPDLDMAVIRTSGLAGGPLAIDGTSYDRGATAVTLGYPGGGPLEAAPASVLRRLTARGMNIYNQRMVDRQVYMLQTAVESGNSGGPVVLPDGTVIGMIFGRSEAEDDIGYAVTSAEIIPRLNQALTRHQPVSTGVCVR